MPWRERIGLQNEKEIDISFLTRRLKEEKKFSREILTNVLDSPYTTYFIKTPSISLVLLNFLFQNSFFRSLYKARQVPEICVCGGPTSTVCAPTTVVTLPSIPKKVQTAPPRELILETLRRLAVDKIRIIWVDSHVGKDEGKRSGKLKTYRFSHWSHQWGSSEKRKHQQRQGT